MLNQVINTRILITSNASRRRRRRSARAGKELGCAFYFHQKTAQAASIPSRDIDTKLLTKLEREREIIQAVTGVVHWRALKNILLLFIILFGDQRPQK